MAAFGERTVTSQTLRDFARSQKRYWPDGRVNVVYPNGDGKRDIPDYDRGLRAVGVEVLDGDRRPRPARARSIPSCATSPTTSRDAIDPKTGLVTNLPGGGGDYLDGMVDWPPQMRYGYDMSTVGAHDAQRARGRRLPPGRGDGASARPAGERERPRRPCAADALTSAIRKRLERPDGVFVDGLLRERNAEPARRRNRRTRSRSRSASSRPDAACRSSPRPSCARKSAMGVINYRVPARRAAQRRDATTPSSTFSPIRTGPGYAADPEAGRDVHVGELGRPPGR